MPDPSLAERAKLRLRVGPGAYSLVGVTHTTASQRAMDSIADLLSGPVMTWDALICTSSAVAATVKMLLTAEADYLKWRLGAQRFTVPQLPVIPLGVHCDDWVTNAEQRSSARQQLGIGPDQLVALFVGRLSSHAKAHPYPMFAALEAAVQRTGHAITLVQCGWFSSAKVEQSFKQGAHQFCPSCKVIWANGKSAEERRRAWASADLFISLSDNIQETFGLTPIEAMAAGLPVIVTDWDGYKDTVREGEDGFGSRRGLRRRAWARASVKHMSSGTHQLRSALRGGVSTNVNRHAPLGRSAVQSGGPTASAASAGRNRPAASSGRI